VIAECDRQTGSRVHRIELNRGEGRIGSGATGGHDASGRVWRRDVRLISAVSTNCPHRTIEDTPSNRENREAESGARTRPDTRSRSFLARIGGIKGRRSDISFCTVAIVLASCAKSCTERHSKRSELG